MEEKGGRRRSEARQGVMRETVPSPFATQTLLGPATTPSGSSPTSILSTAPLPISSLATWLCAPSETQTESDLAKTPGGSSPTSNLFGGASRLAGSIFDTVPSSVLATHTACGVASIPFGLSPTLIVLSAVRLSGEIRETVPEPRF